MNPAAAVRGPKHVVTKGATPVLSPAEARRLLEAIDTGTLAGLRDRALVSVMLYSFARVSAVIGMRRQDYFRQESLGWLRLHEKGGTRHDVPAHHRAAEALDDYLALAGLDEATAALFQSVDPAGAAADGPGALVSTLTVTRMPSPASSTSAQRSAETSDRRSPPMNSSPAITPSRRPRRRGRWHVASTVARSAALNGLARPRPWSADVRR